MSNDKQQSAAFAAEIFRVLGRATVQIKAWHLQTYSEVEHRRLGDLYDGLSGFWDAILEGFQGTHQVRMQGNLDLTGIRAWEIGESLLYINELKEEVSKLYSNPLISEEKGLSARMDDLLDLINTTWYLLSFHEIA